MREDGIEWTQLPDEEALALLPEPAGDGHVYRLTNWDYGQDRVPRAARAIEIVWVER